MGGGDQFARLTHRGVGGPPRVMMQHARVVVGGMIPAIINTMVPSMHDSIVAVVLLAKLLSLIHI